MIPYRGQDVGSSEHGLRKGQMSEPRRRLLPPVWLWLLILAYVVTYGTLSVLKHNTFHSFAYDLGIMSQVLWNTAHGRPFEVSLDRTLDRELVGSYLGDHFRPILLLFAPLYLLWPDPRVLLIAQSLMLGLAAIPLYWIAQSEISHRWLHVGIVICFLMYPALGYLNLFDFHPIALSIPLVLLAYWALLTNRHLVFWVSIVLALATKEEMVIPVAAFGVYCCIRPQYRKQGIGLLALAAVWAVACFSFIMPYFDEGRPYRYLVEWTHLLGQSSAPSSGELAESAAALDIFAHDAVLFLVSLFLPVGFLPLLGPGLLAVCLPSLTYLLLGKSAALHTIGYHYPAVLIPWPFLATIQGLAWLERRVNTEQKPRVAWITLGFLLAAAVTGSFIFNPILFHWRSGAFSSLPCQDRIESALAQIPPEAGVATINAFGPHLAHRRHLISLEWYETPLRQDHLQYVDYVLLDLVDCRAVDASEPRKAYAEMILDLLGTQQFGVQYWSGRILLLRRGAPIGPEMAEIEGFVKALVAEGRECWP